MNVEVLGIAVAITNPCDGAVFQEGTNLAVQAMAHFDFGTITQVDFYTNGSLLGSSSSSPYSVAWSNVRAGSWNLSATARTSTGLSGSSTVVNVMVLRDIRVALTEPSPRTVFPEGTNFTLCATAACLLTVISRVDFYDGGTWVGSADSSPYCIVRSNSPPGLRSLFAVVTETEGLSATSAVVNVAVVPKQPIVGGTLYVDLRATNLLPQGSWVNQGALGDFSAQWPYPGLETNAAGTAFPGVSFNGNQWFVGPDTLPDIEGASDRSIEVWAVEAAPLGTSEILVSSGALLYDSSFAAPTWTPLGPAQTAASTSLTVADDCNFFTNQHRFYRVVRLP